MKNIETIIYVTFLQKILFFSNCFEEESNSSLKEKIKI